MSVFLSLSIFNLAVFIHAAKKCPPLKITYKGRVQATTEYAETIEDFDNLVNPRTIARHFLGMEPSSFILRAIQIEEKSKFAWEDFFFYMSCPVLIFFACHKDDDQV